MVLGKSIKKDLIYTWVYHGLPANPFNFYGINSICFDLSKKTHLIFGVYYSILLYPIFIWLNCSNSPINLDDSPLFQYHCEVIIKFIQIGFRPFRSPHLLESDSNSPARIAAIAHRFFVTSNSPAPYHITLTIFFHDHHWSYRTVHTC